MILCIQSFIKSKHIDISRYFKFCKSTTNTRPIMIQVQNHHISSTEIWELVRIGNATKLSVDGFERRTPEVILDDEFIRDYGEDRDKICIIKLMFSILTNYMSYIMICFSYPKNEIYKYVCNLSSNKNYDLHIKT